MAYAIPGSPCPVYIAGILYPSIFKAADETAITQRWLNVLIKENDGAPIVIKNQVIVTDFWVRARLEKQKGALHD